MIRLHPLLLCYLQTLGRTRGARAVSLYLPALPGVRPEPLLLHAGDASRLPELADVGSAEAFARRAEADLEGLSGNATSSLFHRFASEEPDGWLVRIPTSRALSDLLASVLVEDGEQGPPAPLGPTSRRPPPIWIGWTPGQRKPTPKAAPGTGLAGAEAAGREEPEAWWFWMLLLGGALVAQCQELGAVLLDPVTGLPGRPELQIALRGAVEAACLQPHPVSLTFINPVDFGAVNRRFGRATGDEVLKELARRIQHGLGKGITVWRYGAAIFAVLLPRLSASEVTSLAEELRSKLSGAGYLAGTVRLQVSFGIATWTPGDAGNPEELATELIYRADTALSMAQLAGGSRIVTHGSDLHHPDLTARDRLRGIFTANPNRDYRNMLLIWDTVAIVSAHPPLQELASRVLERLASTFGPDQAAIYRWYEGRPELLAAVCGEDGVMTPVEALTLGPEVRALLEESRSTQRVADWSSVPDGAAAQPAASYWYAIPLCGAGHSLGCLLLGGTADSLVLDSSDLMFLIALGAEVATALHRATREEQERRRLEEERLSLRAELQDLRRALGESKLVYRSPRMASVLEIGRRVASTDATILITGPSGTGKELLAQTIHALSPRRHKKPVVVDCGAISPSLIDSELFGHERGAFTGADRSVSGRLAQAEGSTVILDEIGELPLGVQSRLLRFVQEKQVTPVGATQPQALDVRVVAVTNRDLAAEVSAGRFREDLYHRLNVFHLRIPPLHDRPEDIPILSEAFIERFSLRYQKHIQGLTPEAESELLSHSWPGNVRELENRIMHAVILCQGELIAVEDLGFDTGGLEGRGFEAGGGAEPAVGRTAEALRPEAPLPPAQWPPPRWPPGPPPPAEAPGPSLESLLPELRRALRQEIEALLSGNRPQPAPLGQWLADDLILAALQESGGIASRAAERLQIPDTTFRRRMRRHRRRKNAGLDRRSPGWGRVQELLARIVGSPKAPGARLDERLQRLLLEEVVAVRPDCVATAADLLGVSKPTYRRRLAQLRSERS